MYESEQRRQAKVMNPNNKVSRKVMNPNKVARKSLRARQSQYNTLNANVLYANLQTIVDLKYYSTLIVLSSKKGVANFGQVLANIMLIFKC